ncbi:MAG: serine hydrolase domain-containing protein [Candidatus Thorarchaeota archaeon]|jgi:CubicO group peptidase (beta-lactamase class C family)
MIIRNYRPFRKIVLLLMLMALFLANPVAADTPLDNTRVTALDRDYWPTEEWQNSTPEEQGMDSQRLQDMLNYIDNESINTLSIVIIRNGRIVLEEYRSPYFDADDPYIQYSVTKSVMSALYGIALEEGYFSSLDQRALDFFPERNITNMDPRKNDITLEDLLEMRSGLYWDEWSFPFGNMANTYTATYSSSDPLQHVLELDMTDDPGNEWRYNTGGTHLLSGILQVATNQTAHEFARTHLFDPLGIGYTRWSETVQGVNFGGSGLMLRPRDMARFGYLYINNGTWDGQQVIPASWVSDTTQSITDLWEYGGYGKLWWTHPTDGVYAAKGFSGQYIIVCPKYDIVATFSSNIPNYDPTIEMFYEFILGSVTDDDGARQGPNLYVLTMLVTLALPLTASAIYWFIHGRRR